MKNDKVKILLAEDDNNLGLLITDYLEMEDFDVKLCRDGEEAWQNFQNKYFDICILDVMMPKKDGFTLAKDIKEKRPKTPILFLTAKSLKDDKVEGFRIGADDYITKPFDEEELVLRIKAILKRSQEQEGDIQTTFEIGKYSFDYNKQELTLNGDTRRMTAKENEILKMLAKRKNNVLRREDALIKIWGENDYFHGRSFDVFITKIRKYLKDDPSVIIENIHGVGFMLKDEE